jgi:hypothetical protein
MSIATPHSPDFDDAVLKLEADTLDVEWFVGGCAMLSEQLDIGDRFQSLRV